MSLLQNEEYAHLTCATYLSANLSSFVLYQLRTAYLSSIKDGVGERLINVDSSVLNSPAFRAAGWVPNAADIKRTGATNTAELLTTLSSNSSAGAQLA